MALEQAFMISIFLSPKSTLVVKINDGSPGRSQKLIPGSPDAILDTTVVGDSLDFWAARVVVVTKADGVVVDATTRKFNRDKS